MAHILLFYKRVQQCSKEEPPDNHRAKIISTLPNMKGHVLKIISPVEPADFGLPSRTMLDAVGKNHIAIVIDRKSRVIMSDGKKITEKAEAIKKHKPATKVSVKTTAPVCSKTIKFLSENGIELL